MSRLPLDTAWRRFQRHDLGHAPAPFETLLRGLESAVLPHGLDASAVTLALDLALLADVEEAARGGLVLLVLAALIDLQQGSTRSPRGHLEARVVALARAAGEESAALVAHRLLNQPVEIIGRSPEDRTPLLLLEGVPGAPGFLTLQRIEAAEARLASRLATRLARPEDVLRKADAALADVLARPAMRGGQPVELSLEQRAAVLAVVRRSFTLVSGGPGTGKTSIVVAMLRLLGRLGVGPEHIALAAPTGKAAWRMGEAIRSALEAIRDPGPADLRLRERPPVPATLHRLLGYSPTHDRFEHDPDNPLAARAVVIDEGSMIDVFLMERLLAATRETARLVILGDADQLPSVSAGAVFRDAVQAVHQAAVTLTHSYRMRADDPAGRSVLSVAQQIRGGHADLFGAQADGTPRVQRRVRSADLAHHGVELLMVERPGIRAFLEHWYAIRVHRDPELARLAQQTWHLGPEGISQPQALAPLFDHQSQARLLCLTRGFETGTRRINAWLHEAAAREAGQPPAVPFLVGEPVMMLHNDYDRQLFNGDQGLVLFVDDDDGRRRMAVFPSHGGHFRAFPLDALGPRLELAHALTVHKAQGSEFDQVAILLPEDDLPLLTRELLYTAITRSRKSVILVGSEPLLLAGVRRPVTRFSGLAERLGASNQGPA